MSGAAQYVWISPYNTGGSPVYGASLQLVFGNGLSNTVLRGDYNTYVVYLTSTRGSPVAEVCTAPTAMSPTTVLNAGALPAQYAAAGVTTATFTGNTNLSAWVAGLVPPNVTLSQQVPGGFCDTTTKPRYDNMLVTFTGATVLRCSNAISVAQQGGSKLANYGICQASNSPLTDVTTSGICTTCMWDKYSTYFISTDGGVTGIAVAGTFFRPWTYYTMAVGSTATFTGILTYNYPGWTLTPRDQNDVVGLTVLPANAAYPTITIGSQTNGIKQQTYQWASPGPTLSALLDPNGVTAAANLPIGMPPRVLGPLDTINNAGTTVTGSGVFFCQSGTTGDATCSGNANFYAGSGAAPGQPGWVPDWNGCPNASGFAFIYSGPTSGTQQICGCYPPNYYRCASPQWEGGFSVPPNGDSCRRVLTLSRRVRSLLQPPSGLQRRGHHLHAGVRRRDLHRGRHHRLSPRRHRLLLHVERRWTQPGAVRVPGRRRRQGCDAGRLRHDHRHPLLLLRPGRDAEHAERDCRQPQQHHPPAHRAGRPVRPGRGQERPLRYVCAPACARRCAVAC